MLVERKFFAMCLHKTKSLATVQVPTELTEHDGTIINIYMCRKGIHAGTARSENVNRRLTAIDRIDITGIYLIYGLLSSRTYRFQAVAITFGAPEWQSGVF